MVHAGRTADSTSTIRDMTLSNGLSHKSWLAKTFLTHDLKILIFGEGEAWRRLTVPLSGIKPTPLTQLLTFPLCLFVYLWNTRHLSQEPTGLRWQSRLLVNVVHCWISGLSFCTFCKIVKFKTDKESSSKLCSGLDAFRMFNAIILETNEVASNLLYI